MEIEQILRDAADHAKELELTVKMQKSIINDLELRLGAGDHQASARVAFPLLPAGAADTPRLCGSVQWEPQDWSPGLHDLKACGSREQSWPGNSGVVRASVFSFLKEKRGDESGGVTGVCDRTGDWG